MNTRELRVGNWVMSYDNPDREPEYSEVLAVGCGWALLAKGQSDQTNEDEFEPIQLTPELLKSIGFNIKHQYHSTLYAENCMIVEVEGFELARRFETDNVFLFDTSTHFVPIRYLHQLQNLYFAVIGDELDVKL